MKVTPNKNNPTRQSVAILFLLVITSLSIGAIVLAVTYFSHSSDDTRITLASCPNNISRCDELFIVWQYSLNQRVFEWSLSSGKLIFWISIGITLSGLIFCFWQFWEASSIRRQTETDEIQLKTEVFSLALKTKSIGALILFVSIAYMAIYAVFIYPIEMVDVWASSTSGEVLREIDLPSDTSHGIDEGPIRLPQE